MKFRPGDIIGFSAGDCLGAAVNFSTLGWPFLPPCWRGITHVGIVSVNEHGQNILWESTTLVDQPCLYCGRRHDGVQAHVLENRIAGYDGYIWRYPLRVHLDHIQLAQLDRFCAGAHGTPYDAAGVIDSRTLCLGWLVRRFLKEDTSMFFCSEFTAGALNAMEVWDTPNVSRWNPNRFCRTLLAVGLSSKPRRLK